MPIRSRPLPILALLSLALAACGTSPIPSAPAQRAQAVLQPTTVTQPVAGQAVAGVIDFDQMKDGSVRVSGSVRHLAPGSQVGFHIHEKGVCEGDATSAGGHFNPGGTAHGQPGKGHAGDLPMLHADANGTASIDYVSRDLKLIGPTGIIGRGLIVHRDADDYKTQPTGNAGPRLACAVIAVRN